MGSNGIDGTKIRVAICDDDPSFREGLKRIITATPDIRVVAESESGEDLIELLKKQPVDVLVLDQSLPGRNGLEIIADLRARGITLPVLILSIDDETRYAVPALRAGAAGYLDKGTGLAVLCDALRRLAAGNCYVTDETADRLARELNHAATKQPQLQLSGSEFQVLLAVVAGTESEAVRPASTAAHAPQSAAGRVC